MHIRKAISFDESTGRVDDKPLHRQTHEGILYCFRKVSPGEINLKNLVIGGQLNASISAPQKQVKPFLTP